MYENQEDVFYYLTVMNENYAQPPMPEGAEPGIIAGMYRFSKSESKDKKHKAHLFGSGAIMMEVLKARDILEEKYDVACDVWSVTSYKRLRKDALEVERENMLKPNGKQRKTYIEECLGSEDGVFVAASDYMKALPDSICRWFPKKIVSLGTDGFGRSETRADLRDFFEVDAKHIALATLTALVKDKKIKTDIVKKAIKELKIDPDKVNPMIS
jgi:pyruvate dehydrogenase E1 component